MFTLTPILVSIRPMVYEILTKTFVCYQTTDQPTNQPTKLFIEMRRSRWTHLKTPTVMGIKLYNMRRNLDLDLIERETTENVRFKAIVFPPFSLHGFTAGSISMLTFLHFITVITHVNG